MTGSYNDKKEGAIEQEQDIGRYRDEFRAKIPHNVVGSVLRSIIQHYIDNAMIMTITAKVCSY